MSAQSEFHVRLSLQLCNVCTSVRFFGNFIFVLIIILSPCLLFCLFDCRWFYVNEYIIIQPTLHVRDIKTT